MNSGGSTSYIPDLLGRFRECISLSKRSVQTDARPGVDPAYGGADAIFRAATAPAKRDVTEKLLHSERRSPSFVHGQVLPSTPIPQHESIARRLLNGRLPEQEVNLRSLTAKTRPLTCDWHDRSSKYVKHTSPLFSRVKREFTEMCPSRSHRFGPQTRPDDLRIEFNVN